MTSKPTEGDTVGRSLGVALKAAQVVSGLHRRSPSLTAELQSAVRADEVVVATPELEMFFELCLRASMGERAPR